MKDAKTKISAGVITYNQQSTIRQTLDSILCQHGDFDLEVIVGEDCSTDGTFAICIEYAERYPDLVKLLPNTRNLGIVANFARVMRACTGDYVGICAGDDYWCDEHKLQKQLDYFSEHPDVGVVSTNGYRYYTQRDKLTQGIPPLRPYSDGDIKPYYFSPEYAGGVYAMPLSLLIKRELLQHINFEEFIERKFPVEDYPMQAILAQYTKWGHIDDLCVVYRVYKQSATFISYDSPRYMEYHLGMVDIRRYLNDLFPADACVSEQVLQEYIFYKEFLRYVHQLDYTKAKQLITNVPVIINNSQKVQQATRIAKTRLGFMAFHFYKEFKFKQQLQQRV